MVPSEGVCGQGTQSLTDQQVGVQAYSATNSLSSLSSSTGDNCSLPTGVLQASEIPAGKGFANRTALCILKVNGILLLSFSSKNTLGLLQSPFYQCNPSLDTLRLSHLEAGTELLPVKVLAKQTPGTRERPQVIDACGKIHQHIKANGVAPSRL